MSQQTNARPLVGATDSLLALMIAVAAVAWAHQQPISMAGLGEFLKIRVTSLNASFSIVFAVLWQQCMQALGLYRRSSELLRPTLSAAAGVGLMTLLLGLYLEARRADGPIEQVLFVFFIAAFCYRILRILLSNPLLGGRIADPEQVVIVGSGRRAAKAWRELRTQDHGAKTLLGFVDDRHPSLMPPDIAGRLLGRIDDLPGYLLRNAVDELIVAAPARSCYDMTQRAVAMAEAAGVRVVCLNDLYSLIHDRKLRQRAAVFLELVPRNEAHQFSEAVKRALDIAVAFACLVVLAPMFLAIAVAVKLTSPGPVFFLQERYGWRRRRFLMWKFRSMVHNAADLMTGLEQQNEASGPIFKIRNDPRITPLGRFLRRTSLDELPQLINVLQGTMSLVGPRPMSVRDVSLFSQAQLMRRFSVRPGMTGSWQVAARGSLNFDQWIALDFAYIDDWSLSLDLKILAKRYRLYSGDPALHSEEGCMKIAVVHDYFTQLGGAEKVAEELMRMLPGADLHATVALPECMPPDLTDVPVKTSWMQNLPGMRRYYRLYFLLYPLALPSLDLSGYDLVLSSSSGYAKGVQTNRDAIHVCYCHTPMRWAWSFDNYSAREGMGAAKRLILPHLVRGLRQWDVGASRQPDHFIANSETVAARILRAYGRIAEVIHPPIEVDRFHPAQEQGDYYIVLARLVSYKRIDLAVEACNRLGRRLLVIGDGPDRARLMTNAGPTISFLGLLSNAAVEHHAARCRALIFPGEEDFGMAPLEVAAAGRPAIAYRAGGAVETIIDGVTGVFFDRQEPEDLAEAIARFERIEWNPAVLRRHAESFGTDVFQARFRIFLAKVGAPIPEGALLPFNAPSWADAKLAIGPRQEGIPA